MNNIFSDQMLQQNRDYVKLQQNMNSDEFNLVSGETFAVDPFYNSSSSVLLPVKRQRENADFASAVKRRSVAFGSSSPLINAEYVTQIHNQQQAEIDMFVAQQTEKLRIEIEAKQRTQTRMLASTVQNAIIKKLKEKDDEIIRIRNLNWVLQERVKSLYVENQIWRDLAQTNEANANNLRTNLEHVLAKIETFPATASNVVEDDAESSCGSCGGDGDEVGKVAVSGVCKRCGEREASVLVLPCRHLCLCTVCGSALVRNCPVCDLVMNASVHVNMSS
ncbi:hypothetical protein AALP_AA7G023600 [Arabis alpina]|uniref:RING-type domain-containing protein n=1 Tax=Arabis alpina TaxID=50452 RepID=A0A087GFH1_ARAAL|nr:hypothetical protein AALP_AA7G023600 [Arabis alpina]